jgi:hypothetical protein
MTADAVGNGNTVSEATEADKPKRGLFELREAEAKGLIHLACEALMHGANTAHEIHETIYQAGKGVGNADLAPMITEVRACMGVFDHYLLMLSSVVQERAAEPDTWTFEPRF